MPNPFFYLLLGLGPPDGGGGVPTGSESGFENWIDGQPLAGGSEGTQVFWANGQPVVVQED